MNVMTLDFYYNSMLQDEFLAGLKTLAILLFLKF